MVAAFGCEQKDGLTTDPVQYEQDSLKVYSLNLRFRENYKSDLKGSKIYLDSAYKLAKESKHKWGEAWSLRYYGTYYSITGEYNPAIEKFNESKAIFQSLNDTNGVTSCLNGLANVASYQGEYKKALAYFFETIDLNEQYNNRKGVGIAHHNIGNIHYNLKQYDKALIHYQKSLKIKEEVKDSIGMITSLNAISVVQSSKEKYDEALAISSKALNLAIRFDIKQQLSNLLNNIGVQYYYLEEYDSTLLYYTRALEQYKLRGDKHGLVASYNNLGGLELVRGNGEMARIYNDSSLRVAREINSPDGIAQAYEGLAEAYGLLGQYQKAYEWFQKYHVLNDSISGENVKLQINELEAGYEKEKKDNQIAQLKKKEEASEYRATLYNTIIGVSSIAFVILILAIILYYRNQRSKGKIVQHQLEQKALRAQMNPHFIFNSLNSIQRLYVEGKEDKANDYMADFSRLLRSILENSGKQFVSLKDELAISRAYLELEQLRTDNAFSFVYNVAPDLNEESFMVPPLILQPYLENALWHGILPGGEKGTIKINIRKLDRKKVVCEIIDSGIGIEKSKAKHPGESRNSMGMNITQDRLGGESNVIAEELEEGGTKITLTIQEST